MKEYVESLEREFGAIEKGFLVEQRRAQADLASCDHEDAVRLAQLAYRSDVYQVRMYGVFLLGYLSRDDAVLAFLRETVSEDPNWRVQEVLAKAFDEFCAATGYEGALAVIDDWLGDERANVRRAVTEGLRIWTSRPCFKEHPREAIERLAGLRGDGSEYVRKSVGNALRDISKRFPEMVAAELDTWNLERREAQQVHRLASKLIERPASADRLMFRG